jgi:hypothetical protein
MRIRTSIYFLKAPDEQSTGKREGSLNSPAATRTDGTEVIVGGWLTCPGSTVTTTPKHWMAAAWPQR